MSDDLKSFIHDEPDIPFPDRNYVNFSPSPNTHVYFTNRWQPRADNRDQNNNNLSTMVRSPSHSSVKTAYFYQDGDVNPQTIRLAIHPNRYRSLEALLGELTEKMPKLACGARSIFTPRGRDKIRSLNELKNNGHYICSERITNPRGVQMGFSPPPWRWGGCNQDYTSSPPKAVGSLSTRTRTFPMSGKDPPYSAAIEFNGTTVVNQDTKHRLPFSTTEKDGRQKVSPEFSNSWKNLNQTTMNESKQISVRLDGSQRIRRTVLIRRRHVRSMSQVLQELSALFGMTVQQVYSADGKLVRDTIFLSLLSLIVKQQGTSFQNGGRGQLRAAKWIETREFQL